MAKIMISNSAGLLALPVAMITVGDSKGHFDIVTTRQLSILCMNPMYIGISIEADTYAHELIERSPEFVVNSADEELVYEAALLENISDRNVDKFERAHLTAQPAKHVHPPSVLESPFNIECKVQEILRLGTHDFYAGLVLASYIEETTLRYEDEHHVIDVESSRPITSVAGAYWALGHKIETKKRMAA